MRISDWSSDVCSSDLAAGALTTLVQSGELVQIERGLYALRNTTHEVIAARQIEIGGRFAQIATEIATYIEVNPSKIYRGNAPRFNDWKKAKLHHIYVKIPGYPEIVAVATRHDNRSEEHTSELQSLMRITYAVFCLNKKK